jgi:competence protein ComEA
VRWHWNSALAGALLAAILLGGVTFLWRRPTPPPIAIHAPPAPVTPTPEPTATTAPLVIFISGAVQTPGVYELPGGARVANALERAGGFTVDANVDSVNQAALLRDGDQIYVPTLVEDPAAPPPGLSNEIAPNGVGGLINVNTATLEELDQLPGIGETRAQAIINNRPYASVEDLDRVPGIGAATIEELRPLVVVE